MAEIECPGFSELVACEMDGEYKIAQGWTQSTGQEDPWKYIPPTGWQYDMRYSDIGGALGSHGGCPDCIMTLVHIITVDPVFIDLCEGVTCTDTCVGSDLWSQVCVDGVCAQDVLIEQNSPVCGYVLPGDEEWYDVFVDNAGYFLLFAVAGLAINEIAK
jgi:hypothetical protein